MAADPTLADLLEHDAAQSYFALPLPGYDDRLRAAAVRLRKLDAIEEAVGDPSWLLTAASCRRCSSYIGPWLRRIADALGGTET